jgi:hypothetical protein
MSTIIAIFNGIDTTTPGGATEMLFDLSPYSGTVSPGDTISAIVDLGTFTMSTVAFSIVVQNRLSQPLGVNLTTNKYLGIFTSP